MVFSIQERIIEGLKVVSWKVVLDNKEKCLFACPWAACSTLGVSEESCGQKLQKAFSTNALSLLSYVTHYEP